jgi:exopolyphosphatase/guanosine-5'-triphosphate,3'-diphosphate pyrophosphatase
MVARWEWRTVGSGFGAIDARLRLIATSMRTSDERYVICDQSRESVKIRGGMLEIKTLTDVAPDGLQLWRPVMRVPFPITALEVQEAHARLEVACPGLARKRYTAEEWLADVVGRVPALTTMHVIRTRHGSVIDGCAVGLSDLLVEGAPMASISVAMDDPQRVRRTVKQLGLDRFPSEDFVSALKRAAAVLA